jgi:hypothetical protein
MTPMSANLEQNVSELTATRSSAVVDWREHVAAKRPKLMLAAQLQGCGVGAA